MGGHVIEVHEDHVTNFGDRKICGKGPCGFTDAITSSKDAKERSASKRKLSIAIVMITVFMCVEVFVGIQANSLAILTDAAHLLTDVAAFAISLFSLCASEWEANPRQSYGFFRIEILGALFSMQLIWLLAGFLVYETIARLCNGATGEVQGYLMFGASALGLVVNIAIALLLGHGHVHGHGHGHNHGHGHGHGHEHEHGHCHEHEHGHEITVTTHSHHHDAREPLLQHYLEGKTKPEVVHKKERNINVEGAHLHVLGDSIQSLGVMIGGAIIWYKPEWKIIDLICTLVFSVIVVATTIRMLRNILNVLMESTPGEIDATKVEKGLCEMDEVVAIHELHIWSMTARKVLMACHVIVKPEVNIYMVLDKITDYIKRKFNISHVTIVYCSTRKFAYFSSVLVRHKKLLLAAEIEVSCALNFLQACAALQKMVLKRTFQHKQKNQLSSIRL